MSRPALRAPAEQYGLLAVPPLAEAATLLDRNAQLWQELSVRIFDTPLSQLRESAHQETLSEANAFMARLGLPAVPLQGTGFIVTGHQPELFHPGVWIKNFAAHALARRHGRLSLNLIVDSDLVKTNSIRVPDATGERHHAEFDTGPLQVPYEEHTVADEHTFRHFPATVAKLLGDVPWQPMLNKFWPIVVGAEARTALLGERITVGRHLWETRLGCHNLEVPISRLCGTDSFARFALDLLQNLPRFHQIHNQCLDEFRRRHRIRSRHHPVPALAEIDGWHELPFWVWRADQPRRVRLFAMEGPEGWRLGLLDRSVRPVEHFIPRQTERAAKAWRELANHGWKVRSRALTTTLFARLLLADLFIHGIGGGIYDELTDAIIERYYAMQAPAFLILSATLRLPWSVEKPQWPLPDELHRQLRNLEYHPELFLEPGEDGATTLRRQKQAWLNREPTTKQEKHERFMALKQINAGLSERLKEQKGRTEQELHQARQMAMGEKWRRDREYAFCLYSEEELRKLVAKVLDL
jgi:hypothetical protein